ncbi:MAG TPA: amino acid--[acyl-carrier-protein] ligase [Steroidobacteraceae bacterium]|nr:amino acid--[acyl-carrier-protein] ligase [Steroidobacteraceae bacterium]
MAKYSRDRIQAITDTVLAPTGPPGVQMRTQVFEQVIAGLNGLISRHREAGAEVLHFPPVMSRSVLERQDYHKNFPHLIGCVCSLHGTEAEIRALVSGASSGESWSEALSATDLVLTPATCYSLYPLVAARGALPEQGRYFDVASYCFRREATHEPGRLQSFRMREYVAMGTPELADEFRRRWAIRAEGITQELGLPCRLAAASDPFFGRVGRMMAVSQVEQSLKFELLIPIHSEEAPTACMSFNYHQDHFGATWGLRIGADRIAHTSCVAFGLDRLGLALFATHGLDVAKWPASAREALSL